jgi:hypothetical protein
VTPETHIDVPDLPALYRILSRVDTLPSGFIQPCLPTPSTRGVAGRSLTFAAHSLRNGLVTAATAVKRGINLLRSVTRHTTQRGNAAGLLPRRRDVRR